MDFKTILIIIVVIFAIFWLKDNQPDIYNEGEDTAKDVGTGIWDKVKQWWDDRDTTEPEQPPDDEPEIEDEIINYGLPKTSYECSSDVNCRTYFTEVENIKCNLETGECYTEVN